jgi:3D (Asp-Asp-Asp) domain-containing protein
MEGKKMLNILKTFIAVVVLSGTVSANVQAATVTKQDHEQNTSIKNIELTIDSIHPEKQGDRLLDKAIDDNVSALKIKEWNKLITHLIHPGLNQVILDGQNTVKQEKPAAPSPTPVKAAAAPPATGPSPAPVPKAPQPSSVPAKAVAAPKPVAKAPQESTPAVNTSTREITVKATAYTASCAGCSGITATGINIKANPNAKVIAVDPSVIPLGSKVYVEGFGEATAADTGGAIKGNRIDVFIPSEQGALNFGVKQLKVTILN